MALKNDRLGSMARRGRYPDVIVELMSPSTARIDKGKKKELYQQTFRTPDYFVLTRLKPTPFKDGIAEFGVISFRANERDWLWCEVSFGWNLVGNYRP